MAVAPLSWNDPIFNGVTTSSSITVKDGGSVSYKSITDTGSTASIVGQGSFTLDHVRINSREGVRIGGDGDMVINNSYIETTGVGSDHADGIQAYSPGSSGNLTITNTTIVSHNNAATAGLFIADNYGGTVTLNNVVFEGGPYALRIHADSQDVTVALKDVYFVGPFGYDPFLIGEYGGDIHITQWENVRYATIVNGELVPGALIPSPFPVEGGGTPTVPPADDLSAAISSWSPDSGKTGDGVTNSDKVTLKGTATAGSTVKVLDGTKLVGTVTADSSGNWSFTSSALADGSHKFSATATKSGSTSPASTAVSVVVDTAAPVAPTVALSSSSSTAKAALATAPQVAVLTGTAEANSTVKVFDGTTQIGTATAGTNGAWTFTTSNLSTGSHSFTAKAMDAAGNTGTASSAVSVTISNPTTPTAPGAPTIATFSQDSGVAGDKITNDKTLTLTGTAAANTTIKVMDGTTQVGTATTDSSGKWTLTTSTLKDGDHSLTAIATNASGQTSAASTALAIKVDATAPTAPTLSVSSQAGASVGSSTSLNDFILKGTAEANSTVKVFDGTTQIGTAKANASGAWTLDIDPVSKGTHSFTATATDVAGNASTASAAKSVSVTTSTTPTKPGAPTIATFSQDSGVAGDYITNDKTLTLTGSAAANTTIKVMDGTTQVGSATTDSSGKWTLTTSTLKDGDHSLTALATNASGTSAASTALAIKVDATAPTAPTLSVYSQAGASVGSSTSLSDFILKGTAEANSTVKVFDGSTQIGTAKANASGAWTLDIDPLSKGAHSFTATATDVAGNASTASTAKSVSVTAPSAPPASIEFTSLYEAWNYATIKGTADANSLIKLFDGNTAIGTVTSGADGSWTFKTKALSDTLHTFTAKEIDSSGKVLATSDGQAILGSSKGNVLTGTSGDDYLVGNGNADTFVFAPRFGNDVIKDFGATGWGHDTIQFSSSVFDSFASVLAHASQVGQDVVIAQGADTLTLKNVKLSSLDSHDFQFA